MDKADHNLVVKLTEAVESIVNSGQKHPADSKMKEIKKICRYKVVVFNWFS